MQCVSTLGFQMSHLLSLHLTLPLQVYWTREVGEAIVTGGARGLSDYGDKCTSELNKIVSLVRGQLSAIERSTCGALVVIDVHAR